MFIGHAAGFPLSFPRSVYFSPVSPAGGDPPCSVPFLRAATEAGQCWVAAAPCWRGCPGHSGPLAALGGHWQRGWASPGLSPRRGREVALLHRRRTRSRRWHHAAAISEGLWWDPQGSAMIPVPVSPSPRWQRVRGWPCPRAAGDTAVTRVPRVSAPGAVRVSHGWAGAPGAAAAREVPTKSLCPVGIKALSAS